MTAERQLLLGYLGNAIGFGLSIYASLFWVAFPVWGKAFMICVLTVFAAFQVRRLRKQHGLSRPQ